MLTAKPLVDLARRASRSIFKTAFYSPHWRIGWRFVDESDDVWSRGDLGGHPWQVLRNKPFRFFADPFPVAWNGKTWLFFEDFDHRIGKGRISAVAFGPRGPEGDVFPVLEQPWHLSFPYVFEHEGELWMLPESSNNRTVSLYRAQNFPTRWVKEIDLLVGVEASDSTIVSFEGRLWMFTTVQHDDPSRSNKLLLYHAQSLPGPWSPHSANPVLIDSRSARSAGGIVIRNGVLWRAVQDCERRYGESVGLAEVTRLDENHFEQRVRAIIRPDWHWRGWRLHTLSRAGSLECIDGSAIALRKIGLAGHADAGVLAF
jgi:hypothetical protein